MHMTRPKQSHVLSPLDITKGKLLPWTKFQFLHPFKLAGKARAAVVTNGHGRAQYFVLNTFALLDVLSAIDDPLSHRLSIEEYHSKKINPAGWLIDEIESQLPLNPKLAASLKKAVAQAKQKGWVPLENIVTKPRRS